MFGKCFGALQHETARTENRKLKMVWENFGFRVGWIWWDLFGIKICGVLEEIQKPVRINYQYSLEDAL